MRDAGDGFFGVHQLHKFTLFHSKDLLFRRYSRQIMLAATKDGCQGLTEQLRHAVELCRAI